MRSQASSANGARARGKNFALNPSVIHTNSDAHHAPSPLKFLRLQMLLFN